jgi:hypothetical protein
MIDFGYPQITEVKVLQEFIKTESRQLIEAASKKKNQPDKISDV